MIRNFIQSDIDYVIKAHTRIYADEYNFDSSFEAFIADTMRKFIENLDSDRENLWIAESDQQPAGSVAIVKIDNVTAQLRWFLVEPRVRGNGIGNELLKKAISFSKEKGYESIALWTSNLLAAARCIYAKHGFSLRESVEEIRSGIPMIEERWELSLND
jgi:GNAT superfamily N-acetyltransferase